LIISKLDWARDSRSQVHFTDVCNLLAAGPDLDREYLSAWVSRLGLDSLYQDNPVTDTTANTAACT